MGTVPYYYQLGVDQATTGLDLSHHLSSTSAILAELSARSRSNKGIKYLPKTKSALKSTA